MKTEIPSEDSNSSNVKQRFQWWHWSLGALLTLVILLMIPRATSPEFSNLIEGSVSQIKVIAPFDFEVLKNTNELEIERREAAALIQPYVNRIDSIGNFYHRELIHFGTESYSILSELLQSKIDLDTAIVDTLGEAHARDKLSAIFGFRLSRTAWEFVKELHQIDRTEQRGAYFRYFENKLGKLQKELFERGILNVEKSQIAHPSGKLNLHYIGEEVLIDSDKILTVNETVQYVQMTLQSVLQNDSYPRGANSAGNEILQAFISPNLIYDPIETESRRNNAIAKVPLANGVVKKDELIIDKNHVLKSDHIAKLKSLSVKRAELDLERSGFRVIFPTVGYFIVIVFAIGMLSLQIIHSRPKIWYDWKLLTLLVVLILGTLIVNRYFPLPYDLARYVIPVAIVAMLMSILIDKSVALAGVVFIAIIIGLIRGFDYQVTFINLIAGGAALIGMRKVVQRNDVMGVILYLGVAMMLMVFAFRLAQYTLDQRVWTELLIAMINVLLAPILVLGLVYALEKIFRITTNFTLLELLDFNHPLLREMALKSPGTYHHSIMVGNLAEAAARAIGADALLTRAGAYYHDIGKISQKEYYIENQEVGSKNIHDSLPPTTSAKILVSHVLEGVKLAEQYQLPEPLFAFIKEHHGKSKIAYFYHKACKEQGEKVDEALFRYPGPSPQSKETGIMMLADLVEAATRALDAKHPEELKPVIEELVRNRLSDGDLDECPLTLRDLDIIKDAFIKVISNARHQRINYPKGQIAPKTDSENKDVNTVVTN